MSVSKHKNLFGLSPNIFFLGVVSFLTDISSELIFTLLPLFLANVLGVATVVIGFVEGVAESTASLLKIFSGWVSDRLGNRKSLAFIGYALSSLSKPFMLIATSWGPIMAIRFADRLGKGIRTAPRDALVAGSCDDGERGKAYGFHRAMDTSGAALGLVLAAIVVFLLQRDVMTLTLDTYKWLVILGIIPAFIALFFFVFIKESPGSPACTVLPAVGEGGSVAEEGKAKLGNKFRIFLFTVFLFTLGNSSDAFLVLRAQNLGNSVLYILLMMVVLNVVYALFSMPAGMLSDKLGRRKLIVLGWSLYAAVYLGFALINEPWAVWVLFVLYGLYYGLAEGVARALVCDMVPQERIGTAFGLFHGVVGLTLMPASLIAGWLWQAVSPAAPFYFGAVMAAMAVIGLLIFIRD